MQLRESNQPFTNCLSSSSCLRSQSASERTMVSWGPDEEEASPLMGVVTPEERGVSGIRVSSSILRSCCHETDSFWVAPKYFLHIFNLWAQAQTHLFIVLPLLLCHLPLCVFPLLLQLFLLPPVLLLLPWQQTREIQQRAPAKNPLKVCIFQQEKKREAQRHWKAFWFGNLIHSGCFMLNKPWIDVWPSSRSKDISGIQRYCLRLP